MTEMQTDLIDNVEVQNENSYEQEKKSYEEQKKQIEAKQTKLDRVGLAALILGFLCFIWAFVNITLFSQPVAPTDGFGTTTPIFTVKMSNGSMFFSLTANGIIFVLVNLVLLSLTLTYFLMKKDFWNNLKLRIPRKKAFVTTITFASIVLAMYLIMFIMGFVPPSLTILLNPESGNQIVGNFTALFNWSTRSITVRNAGFYVMIVLFTITLGFFIATAVLYFAFIEINYSIAVLSLKVKNRKESKEAKKAEQPIKEKVSLREIFAKAREAKAKAKQEKLANNTLKQNLTDVNVDIQQTASIQPEIIEVDQQGSANQETYNELPTIEEEPKVEEKQEPRRLAKLFANIKEKKKNKGTNINKKATVAAPTKEINDLVKQLMPD